MPGFLITLVRSLIYISGIWILFRRLYRRKVRVLMYHGICESEINLWTQVSLREFERQMSYVARHYRAITMSHALDVIKGEKPPPNHAVVMTFDDGFMSNKTLAYPVLKKHGIPAEIYVTTSFIDRAPRFQGMIRTDYVVGLFRRSKHDKLDLRDQGFGEIVLGDAVSRIEAGYRISNTLKRISRHEENRLIGVIEDRLGADFTSEDRRIFGSLSWDDARQLLSEGLVTFGAHTVGHEILSRLDPADLLCEVADSQKVMEQKLESPVRHFAYPNGTRSDFNDDVKKTVAKYYDCALATIEGFNGPGMTLTRLRDSGLVTI